MAETSLFKRKSFADIVPVKEVAEGTVLQDGRASKVQWKPTRPFQKEASGTSGFRRINLVGDRVDGNYSHPVNQKTIAALSPSDRPSPRNGPSGLAQVDDSGVYGDRAPDHESGNEPIDGGLFSPSPDGQGAASNGAGDGVGDGGPADMGDNVTLTLEEALEIKDEAYDEGYQKGLEDGKEQANSAHDLLYEDLLNRLNDALSSKGKAHRIALDEIALETAEMALDVLSKFTPIWLQRFGEDEIIAMLHDNLGNLQNVSKILIKVHPDHVEGLKEKLDGLFHQNGMDKIYELRGDYHLDHGDVKMDWGAGGLSHQGKDIRAHFEGALKLIRENAEDIRAKTEGKSNAKKDAPHDGPTKPDKDHD